MADVTIASAAKNKHLGMMTNCSSYCKKETYNEFVIK